MSKRITVSDLKKRFVSVEEKLKTLGLELHGILESLQHIHNKEQTKNKIVSVLEMLESEDFKFHFNYFQVYKKACNLGSFDILEGVLFLKRETILSFHNDFILLLFFAAITNHCSNIQDQGLIVDFGDFGYDIE